MKTLLISIVLSLQLILFPVAASANSTVGYAKAVSTLALGSVGVTSLTSCKNGVVRPSMWIFTASSVALIAGDAILAKKYTDYQKKKRSELELKESELKDANGDYQKEIIDQRLELEQQELKNISGREVLHYAMGTAMLAAMTVALFEGTSELVPPPVPNPYFMYTVFCDGDSLKPKLVAKAVQMAWSVAAGLGGGTSGAGSWFTYLQMALGLMTETMSKASAVAMKTGYTRAAFFGANSALLYWVAADLSGRKSEVKKNIKKLEDIKIKLAGTSTKDGLSPKVPAAADYKKTTQPKMNIKTLPTVAESKTCLSVNGEGTSIGSSACKNALKLTPMNFKGSIDIPDLQNIAGQTIATANDLAAGNWDGAEVALADIGSKAAQIRNLADKVEKKINDDLKAQGKPTIDFKGDIAKQTAAIQQAIDSASGSSESNSLAAIPQATLGKDVEEKEEGIASSDSTAPATEVPLPGMDLGGLSSTAEGDPALTSPSKSIDESLNDYEVAENDISTKTDVSIFKQVSNRYILNYKNFFNEKKTLTPEAPAKPAPSTP